MAQRFITFETVSEPIDPDMEQLATKPLFAQIVDGLRRKGSEIAAPPSEYDSYGWYADFQVGTSNLTCMMQRSDSWLLIVSSNRSLMDCLKGRHYDSELNDLAGLISAVVKEEFDVSAQTFNSEEEFRKR